MDDAIDIRPLPDDPAALKSIIAMIARQREEAKSQREETIRQREEATRQLQQRIDELEVAKLRLEVELLRLKKWYYGPRSDRLNAGQLLLEFAVALEQRPVNEQDLPPGSPGENGSGATARWVRIRRGRRNIAALERLPLLQDVHDLPEDQKPCPCCGKVRERIGRESTWQIEYFPAEGLRPPRRPLRPHRACAGQVRLQTLRSQRGPPADHLGPKAPGAHRQGDGWAGAARRRHDQQVCRPPAAVPPGIDLPAQRL